MNADLEFLLVAAGLIAPVVLVASLRKTPWFWTPGVALIVLGFLAFGAMPDTHDDVGGMAAMAAGIFELAGIGLIVYGLVCLLAGTWGQRQRLATPASESPSPPAVELPPAIVVGDLPARRGSDAGAGRRSRRARHRQSGSSCRNAK